MAVAAAALVPENLTHADEPKTPAPKPPPPSPLVEVQAQAIFAKHGKHLSTEQKADVKRLLADLAKTGDTLRSLPLANSDEPAAIFRVFRSEKE
jgi:hypothetical protein